MNTAWYDSLDRGGGSWCQKYCIFITAEPSETRLVFLSFLFPARGEQFHGFSGKYFNPNGALSANKLGTGLLIKELLHWSFSILRNLWSLTDMATLNRFPLGSLDSPEFTKACRIDSKQYIYQRQTTWVLGVIVMVSRICKVYCQSGMHKNNKSYNAEGHREWWHDGALSFLISFLPLVLKKWEKSCHYIGPH